MRLQQIEIAGFKSFAKKATLTFTSPVTSVVGPNGSGKSNVVEAFRFVLGEQSMKSMRGKSGTDLIFRGSNSSSKLSRASVSITFDNSDNIFAFQGGTDGESKSPVLFDRITFTREIYADGASKYLMNGTEIKLKQMVELLSSVNIGTSTHHIISQGEADGILRASARDRREMLEDALGLKIYHFRIKETENKLAKSLAHMKEVQSLRRELGPHLVFLKKQVEKVERAQSLRTELQNALLQFLSTERELLGREEASVRDALSLIETKKGELETRLKMLPETHEEVDIFAPQIEKLRRDALVLAQSRDTLQHKMGKLEGMIEARRAMAVQTHVDHSMDIQTVSFASDKYQLIVQDVELAVRMVREASTLELAKAALAKLESVLRILQSHETKHHRNENVEHEKKSIMDAQVHDIALELESLQKEFQSVIEQESKIVEEIQVLENKRSESLRQSRAGVEERYVIKQQLTECNAEIQVLNISKGNMIARKELFDTELKEAGFMFGPSFLHELQRAESVAGIDMHDLRRSIDRLKIRLDEHSGIGNDVITEYQSTKERDEFLLKEMTDIESSVKNLETLLIDLKKVLDERFTTGVQKINERFGQFFKTMFGGGSAFLEVTLEKKRKRKSADEDMEEEMGDDEDVVFERGIEVHVSLPEKKVKELNMLSGGERSLVSIALLFAISQVNPPPFLVLDETDAALDEANSRRYGDMIERLSEYSQLIVVTHNRETMSRASVLYGVTLGTDGGSKLLSIKFDEAVKVAK